MWSERERGIAATEPSSNDAGAWGHSNTGSRASTHAGRFEGCVTGGQTQPRIQWSRLENRAHGNRAHILLATSVHRIRVVTVLTANCQHSAEPIALSRQPQGAARRIAHLDTGREHTVDGTDDAESTQPTTSSTIGERRSSTTPESASAASAVLLASVGIPCERSHIVQKGTA